MIHELKDTYIAVHAVDTTNDKIDCGRELTLCVLQLTDLASNFGSERRHYRKCQCPD